MNILKKLLAIVVRFSYHLLPPQLLRECQALSIVVDNADHQYLSQNFLNALIVAEDKRYLSHLGVDPIAVVRAFWSLAVKQKLQGASTIEQQLVRTITRRYEITLARKIREILLASILSASFSKDQIARAYLCVAYFGWQMNGIDQACKHLSIDQRTASVIEAAHIVARLKYPEPREASPKRLKQIQDRVIHILQLQQVRPN